MPKKAVTRKTLNAKKAAATPRKERSRSPMDEPPEVKKIDEPGPDLGPEPFPIRTRRLSSRILEEMKRLRDEDPPETEKEKPEEAKKEDVAEDPKGEVPPGKDPSADEEGFIPLSEAIRRTSGSGAAPNIVPNWISSNFSQDGEVGLDEYRRELLALVDRNKVFPKGWDHATVSGLAQVSGAVDGMTGRLLNVRLANSSGSRELDRAALATITKCDPFPPIGSMGVLYFQIGIKYGPNEQASR